MRAILRGSGRACARGPLRHSPFRAPRQRNRNAEQQDCANKKLFLHTCSFVEDTWQKGGCRTWPHTQLATVQLLPRSAAGRYYSNRSRWPSEQVGRLVAVRKELAEWREASRYAPTNPRLYVSTFLVEIPGARFPPVRTLQREKERRNFSPRAVRVPAKEILPGPVNLLLGTSRRGKERNIPDTNTFSRRAWEARREIGSAEQDRTLAPGWFC